MDSHSGNSGPLVPRNVYTQAILKELNAAPYNPEHHNGMRNPYSHTKITCKDDYNEYVREYVYYRLCDEAVKQQYDIQISLQSDQLKAQHQSEVDSLVQQHNGKIINYWLRSFLIIILLIAVLIYAIPARYQQGYVTGYADALLDKGISSSVHTTTPKPWVSVDRTVYVSRSGHKIHLDSNCSGMMYYSEMRYGVACAAGYAHCSKCF